MAYRELAQINSQADAGSDQILMFQTLLQKWQDQLNTNWSVNFEFIRHQQFKKCKYERKKEIEDPMIIMSMLNSQIISVQANKRFSTYMSSDGSLFVMGRDFRPMVSGDDGGSIYGLPKYIKMN